MISQDLRPRGGQLQLESLERNSLGQTAAEASAQAEREMTTGSLGKTSKFLMVGIPPIKLMVREMVYYCHTHIKDIL